MALKNTSVNTRKIETITKHVNDAYLLALFTPFETLDSILDTLQYHEMDSPDSNRIRALNIGFNIGLKKRKKERLLELARIKKTKDVTREIIQKRTQER